MLRSSLYSSRVVHQAGAYPGFHGMKKLGIFLPTPSPRTGSESIAGYSTAPTHLQKQLDRVGPASCELASAGAKQLRASICHIRLRLQCVRLTDHL